MAKQTGARYIKRQRQEIRDKEEVCTQHIKRESELERLPSGAVKRKK